MEASERQFASRRADAISQRTIFCYKLNFGNEGLFVVRSSNKGVFAIREVSWDLADAICNDRPPRSQVFGGSDP